MKDKKIIVAIDGYSSTGKSTMAKQLASYAGYAYVDTGAMYRALGWLARREGVMTADSVDEERLKTLVSSARITFVRIEGTQHTIINGEDVEAEIRTLEIGDYASRVSTIGFVRRALVSMQRRMGEARGIVMDGRDIGTVVFPDAELKVFVTTSPERRAERRYNELREKGMEEPYEQVLANIIERDRRDTTRAESPLRRAEDALLLDNSDLTIERQMQIMIGWFEEAKNK